MIYAGSAKLDITPDYSVWMDGMIRSHKSEGIHDRLHLRALVLQNGENITDAVLFFTIDICALSKAAIEKAKQAIHKNVRISKENIIFAATHTHSAPACYGFFNPIESQYLNDLINHLSIAAADAVSAMRPAELTCVSGRENTISHYRRFCSSEGKTVMFWEENPAESNMRALGEPDPEVGVVKITDASDANKTIAVLFNHAGHPNVMSGDNYLLSAEYPGAAMSIIEEKLGGFALFINGAQGSVDIDNWTYNNWDDVFHLGNVLAQSVISAVQNAPESKVESINVSSTTYKLNARQITDSELKWAEDVLISTGGIIKAIADGVGDDYKAQLYKKLREAQNTDIEVKQTCVVLGDTALLTFPGELFTEIGARIKSQSPFKHTYILGLANGYIGYIPTQESIPQRGYEVDTRAVCDQAEEIIIKRSLALLNELKHK